jgi:hypothetical protein
MNERMSAVNRRRGQPAVGTRRPRAPPHPDAIPVIRLKDFLPLFQVPKLEADSHPCPKKLRRNGILSSGLSPR